MGESVQVPAGWRETERSHVGPFVTRLVLTRPDGSEVEWSSRRHRKGHGLRVLDGTPTRWPRLHTIWRPNVIGWWIGVCFMVGSACFVLGSVPRYAAAVGAVPDALTFFVGSIFFTTAGYLQYRESINAPEAVDGVAGHSKRWFAWQPDRLDWWATAVQLAGTLFFNLSTGFALVQGLDTQQLNRAVWAPDVFGSICFLVASQAAVAEVCHGWFGWKPHDPDWTITMLNLVGSIFFGVSAIAAFYTPSTGEMFDATAAATYTLLGAVCFFVGAAMLLPDRDDGEAAISSS